MNYLYNKLKPKAKFHFWNAIDEVRGDTACLLWSTGGIKKTRPGWVVVTDKPERELCHMCSERSKWAEKVPDK